MTRSNLEKNKVLPNFELLSTDGTKVTNQSIMETNAVFFLYPKNNTPTCTNEAISFSDNIEKFKMLKILVFGVSVNSIKSHKNFITKHSLNLTLLSDQEHQFIESMGAWVEKKMYGNTYLGTERTTILVEKSNKIIKVWRNVKVSGHVDEVLDFGKKSLTNN